MLAQIVRKCRETPWHTVHHSFIKHLTQFYVSLLPKLFDINQNYARYYFKQNLCWTICYVIHITCWAVNWFTMSARLLFHTSRLAKCINMSCTLLKYIIYFIYQQFVNQNWLFILFHISLFRSLHQSLKFRCLSNCDVIRCVMMSKTFVTRLAERRPASE